MGLDFMTDTVVIAGMESIQCSSLVRNDENVKQLFFYETPCVINSICFKLVSPCLAQMSCNLSVTSLYAHHYLCRLCAFL